MHAIDRVRARQHHFDDSTMRGAPATYQETPYFAAMLRAFASSDSQERRLATRFFAGLEGFAAGCGAASGCACAVGAGGVAGAA